MSGILLGTKDVATLIYACYVSQGLICETSIFHRGILTQWQMHVVQHNLLRV